MQLVGQSESEQAVRAFAAQSAVYALLDHDPREMAEVGALHMVGRFGRRRQRVEQISRHRDRRPGTSVCRLPSVRLAVMA